MKIYNTSNTRQKWCSLKLLDSFNFCFFLAASLSFNFLLVSQKNFQDISKKDCFDDNKVIVYNTFKLIIMTLISNFKVWNLKCPGGGGKGKDYKFRPHNHSLRETFTFGSSSKTSNDIFENWVTKWILGT